MRRGARALFAAWSGLAVLTCVTPSPSGAHAPVSEQVAMVEEAMAEDPSDPRVHLSRAQLHRDQGEWTDALLHYHSAASLGASPAVVARNEGETHRLAGWPRKAVERFSEALRLDPADAIARIGRGRALMDLGRAGEAARDIEIALALVRRAAPSLVIESRTALVAAGAPERALAVLDRQLERAGEIPSLELAAIDLEADRGDFDAALRRVDRLLEKIPDHPQWAARRGEILERAGRHPEAAVAYREALDVVRARTARRRSRRLEELGGELVAALARNTHPERGDP